MSSYDEKIQNGAWHTCKLCGIKYSDSDGQCDCQKWECDMCESAQDENAKKYEYIKVPICKDCYDDIRTDCGVICPTCEFDEACELQSEHGVQAANCTKFRQKTSMQG